MSKSRVEELTEFAEDFQHKIKSLQNSLFDYSNLKNSKSKNLEPLTLNSLINQHSSKKKNENSINENNSNNLKGNFLINRRKSNFSNNNDYFQNVKQKFRQTTPVTFRNSRKSSNEKKVIYNNYNNGNIYIQGRKNSILSNINTKTFTIKKLLSEEMNKLKLNSLNDNFLINNNILPLSISSREKMISPRNLTKKEFSSTGKKSHHKILNLNRNEGKLIMKHSLLTNNTILNKKNLSKDNKEEGKKKKIFLNSKNSSICKTISHKASITKIQDLFKSENLNKNNLENINTNIINNNTTNNLENITNNIINSNIHNNSNSQNKTAYCFINNNTITNKKKIIIEPKVFSSNNKNNKTKSIFKQEIEKKINKDNKNEILENKIEKTNLTQCISQREENNLIEKYEITEKEKQKLIKQGKYYKQLSLNLSNYIKDYYKIFKDYPLTKLSFYKFGRLIGKGAFGKVNLGLHILSGKIVAIKSFNKKKLKDEKSKQKIYNEINLMKSLKHNSIVKILETIETQNYILIIMENISGGDLLTYVKKRTKLNEKTSKFIFKQLITSIKYIHSKNIIHRDIKLDNILIDLNNNIKLCDFGVGKYYNNNNDKFSDQCGTPAYIAPEILCNNFYSGPPVDIWSSGVVLYAMLSGTVPFKGNNIKELHKKIICGNYKKINDISFEANNLIEKLLEIDPNKRICINEILCHPWICKGDNFNIEDKKFTLFTKAEIVLLSKEKLDYRNCNQSEIIENFTINNLYTINDKENKDICTKSNILAPFSSSIDSKNLNDKSAFLNSEIEIENDNVKFNEKVNVLNRQYELNNNGEIDHGILINHSNEDNEEKKGKKIKEEILNINNYDNNNNDFDNIINKNYKIKFSNHLKNIKSAPDNKKYVQYSKEDSKRNNSSLTNSSTFVDENVIKIMENYGYKRDYVHKCLINNEFNYATATFFLLSNNFFDGE